MKKLFLIFIGLLLIGGGIIGCAELPLAKKAEVYNTQKYAGETAPIEKIKLQIPQDATPVVKTGSDIIAQAGQGLWIGGIYTEYREGPTKEEVWNREADGGPYVHAYFTAEMLTDGEKIALTGKFWIVYELWTFHNAKDRMYIQQTILQDSNGDKIPDYGRYSVIIEDMHGIVIFHNSLEATNEEIKAQVQAYQSLAAWLVKHAKQKEGKPKISI